MSIRERDLNFSRDIKSFENELLSFTDNFMTIHRFCLATQLEVTSLDRLEKNVQIASQPKWKCFPNTAEHEEAWRSLK